MKKAFISLFVAVLLCSGMAHAVYTPTVNTTGNNFTMVSSGNTLSGGTNDVGFSWDGTYRTAVVTDGSYNATISSVSPYSGNLWTAHHVNIYGPGSYVFNTGCASGGPASTSYNPSCGTGASYTFTVPAGQVGAHMLFDWSGNMDIDMVVLWDMSKSWTGTATPSPMQQGSSVGAPATTITTVTLNNSIKTVTQKKWGLDSIYPGAITTSTLIKGTGVTTIQTLAGGCVENNSSMTVLALPASCYTNTAAKVWDGVAVDTPMDADVFAGSLFIDGPFIASNAGSFNVMGIVASPTGWFSFTPQTGVAASTTITSNLITVAGVAPGTAISITGGNYSKNAGAYTAVAGVVSNGDTVGVQLTSNASAGGTATATVTIAGLGAKNFTATTFVPDTTPDAFTFTPQTGVALNALMVSNAATVGGINTATPISVTGGEYSINGGAYTSIAGSVTVGQTVTVRHTSANSNVAVVNAVLTIGGVTSTFTSTTKAANSTPFTAAFTMLTSDGILVGRDTSVTGTYDDTNTNTSSFDTKFNMTLQSSVPFYGQPWTAHDVRVFGPGTYTVNSACTVAELRANGGASCASNGPPLTFTVNAGQKGAHILFDWNGNNDIDVALVWNTDGSASAVPDSAGVVYQLSSQDGNGDGVAGFRMVAGPFIGFNANFDIKFSSYSESATTVVGGTIGPGSWQEVASSTFSPSAMPANFSAGNGGVEFLITGVTPGGSVTIVMSAPNLKVNDKAYWVDGSGVFHPITGAIYDFSAKTVTYTATDGGFGDTDNVPGQISDPFVVLSPIPQVASSSSGGGGGCAMGGSAFDPVLPGSLLVALSWLGWRRRKGE